MKPILEIKGISKKFRINHEQQPYLSLRDSIASLFNDRSTKEDFWALKDVSFDVMPGDTVGIIGKNGAGKSTLLKILSKITPPSKGRIVGRGRIASLLEVGTGFHPELTGRENIFMNGSILGMKHLEIQRNFDAIVDFAGVEKFLDTPLKHYSSGMQLRLAFAVAAFLENEILIIDEVLAVGDAEFQKKCIGKMEDVSKSGRTVLFVSHNMEAIRALCSKGVVLSKGTVDFKGDIVESINHYVNLNSSSENTIKHLKYIKEVSLLCDGQKGFDFYSGSNFQLRITFNCDTVIEQPVLGVIIKDSFGSPLIGVNNKNYGYMPQGTKSGEFVFTIPNLPLFEGNFSVDVRLGSAFKELEIANDICQFSVMQSSKIAAMEKPMASLNKLFIDSVTFQLKEK